MASLATLEEAVEAYCRARAHVEAEAARGHPGGADEAAVERAHPRVVSPETLSAVVAAAESPRTTDAHRPRLLALVPFLRRATLLARARPAVDALASARAQATVHAAGRVRPLEGVWAAVAAEADTGRRAALARAASEAELALLGPVQRRWEALAAAAEGLGAAPAPPGPALLAEAQGFLHATEDAFRDVLGFALRRLEPNLRPLPHGDAGLQELLRLSRAPLPSAFPGAEGISVLRRWLSEAGLPLEADGRLRVEEDGGTALAEATAVAVEVPQHILLLLPGEGRGSFPRLLEAAGRARARAAVTATASLAARRLGDAAVRASGGLLFQGVVASAPWLRRFLGTSRTEAREVARLSALAQLGTLRLLAAQLLLRPEAEGVEPTPARLSALASAASEALFLQVPEGAVLEALSRWPTEAETLSAAALAECLRAQADERFDAEDFRNPAAARWLAQVWARGTDVDAGALAAAVGGRLSLADVGRRLVGVLGA